MTHVILIRKLFPELGGRVASVPVSANELSARAREKSSGLIIIKWKQQLGTSVNEKETKASIDGS